MRYSTFAQAQSLEKRRKAIKIRTRKGASFILRDPFKGTIRVLRTSKWVQQEDVELSQTLKLE